jgi:hypothetical protein
MKFESELKIEWSVWLFGIGGSFGGPYGFGGVIAFGPFVWVFEWVEKKEEVGQ